MSSVQPFARRLRNVTIEPAPHGWNDLVHARWKHDNFHRATFRAELGLPSDRPVIMTGHQAEFWHPGILAKYIATNIAAKQLDATPAWIVVDQDANAPADIRYPRRVKNGSLAAATWQALPAADVLAARNVPLSSIPAAAPAALTKDARNAADSLIIAGLDAINASLARHAAAGNVAEQVFGAAIDQCRDILAVTDHARPTVTYATSLARTSLFKWLVEQMLADPTACVAAYNAAVTAYPDAGMKPLETGANPELPLWIIRGTPRNPLPRERATVASLAAAPSPVVAPRALLMTAMLRLAGCELFIHGLGGGIYDPVTEHWLHHWLGLTLAPAAVVSATLTLPLAADVMPPADIDRAVWLAHHAKHDPARLGDSASAADKQAILERIRTAKARGDTPWAEFAELHALLDRVRAQNQSTLARLAAQAADADARRAESTVLHDRSWPFPLYPAHDLAALADAIATRFQSQATHTPVHHVASNG